MPKGDFPILLKTHTVVLGGTVSGLACAVKQAELGNKVLLMEQGTCLYSEMDQAAWYALPDACDDPLICRLFPIQTRGDHASFAHPDRLKQHGEALCAQLEIQLLYATQAVQWQDETLLIAHKSGIYAICCKQVFDCRMPAGSRAHLRYFALHVMNAPAQLPPLFSLAEERREGDFVIPCGGLITTNHTHICEGHAICRVPILSQSDETTAQGRFCLYELALEAFRQLREQPGCKGITLARSGFSCIHADSMSLKEAIARGLAACACEHIVQRPVHDMKPSAVAHWNPLFTKNRHRSRSIAPSMAWEGDVLVVGGGTAGAVAAYSAARQGMRVRLLEMNEMLGGTATCGGVSIYWFGTRDGATAEIDARVDGLYRSLGLPRSRCLWSENDVFLPDLKAHALLALCLEAGVDIVFGAFACAAIMENKSVSGVVYAAEGELFSAHAMYVIDATGDADVAMLAGAQHSYGGDSNRLTYWGSLAQYTSPANYRNNFSTMVHVGNPLDYTRFIIAGRLLGEKMYDHGRYVALRESRHIRGMSTLTLADLLAGRPSEDVLYQCFSNYDPKGKLTADSVYAGLLPPNMRMNVPRGAVIPLERDGKPLHGILVGGKAISCTHDALPGLRMQPDLQQQGYALGVLAALSVRQNTPAWQTAGVSEAIKAAGGQSILPITQAEMTIAQAVHCITGNETLEWLEMDAAVWRVGQNPIIKCFLADSKEALPALRKAYADQGNTPSRQLLLARLLLWHGCEEGVSVILEAIRELLKEAHGLPPRKGPITFGQLLPDHGLMPEAVYLLNLLAWGKHISVTEVFAEVLERLKATERDFRDLRAGIYCYIECFAYVAMRRGEQAFLEMLHELQALPELADDLEADKLLAERYAMLRLSLAEACTRLGDTKGLEALQALTQYPVQAISASAQMLLADIQKGLPLQPITLKRF